MSGTGTRRPNDPTASADVVVMNLRMRQVDGIEATRRVRDHADSPPVLALTTFEDEGRY